MDKMLTNNWLNMLDLAGIAPEGKSLLNKDSSPTGYPMTEPDLLLSFFARQKYVPASSTFVKTWPALNSSNLI